MDAIIGVLVCVLFLFLCRAIVDVPFEKGSISRRFPDVFCSYSWATTNATDIPFVVLMSDDKDMRQIVNENVYILTPGR